MNCLCFPARGGGTEWAVQLRMQEPRDSGKIAVTRETGPEAGNQ